jgi:hypothetical protein
VTAPQPTAEGILSLVFWCWVLGLFLLWSARRLTRGIRRARREAAELRHRRAVELAYARSGRALPGETEKTAGVTTTLPAAVIPTPPGARPLQGTPGPCRHERIVPVIDGDGDVQRWICANFERCDAEFPPGTAMYEAGDSRG